MTPQKNGEVVLSDGRKLVKLGVGGFEIDDEIFAEVFPGFDQVSSDEDIYENTIYDDNDNESEETKNKEDKGAPTSGSPIVVNYCNMVIYLVPMLMIGQ